MTKTSIFGYSSIRNWNYCGGFSSHGLSLSPSPGEQTGLYDSKKIIGSTLIVLSKDEYPLIFLINV